MRRGTIRRRGSVVLLLSLTTFACVSFDAKQSYRILNRYVPNANQVVAVADTHRADVNLGMEARIRSLVSEARNQAGRPHFDPAPPELVFAKTRAAGGDPMTLGPDALCTDAGTARLARDSVEKIRDVFDLDRFCEDFEAASRDEKWRSFLDNWGENGGVYRTRASSRRLLLSAYDLYVEYLDATTKTHSGPFARGADTDWDPFLSTETLSEAREMAPNDRGENEFFEELVPERIQQATESLGRLKIALEERARTTIDSRVDQAVSEQELEDLAANVHHSLSGLPELAAFYARVEARTEEIRQINFDAMLVEEGARWAGVERTESAAKYGAYIRWVHRTKAQGDRRLRDEATVRAHVDQAVKRSEEILARGARDAFDRAQKADTIEGYWAYIRDFGPKFEDALSPNRRVFEKLESGRNPADCGVCHKQAYDQWNTSPHANSWIDPIFKEATRGYAKKACLACHASVPLAEWPISTEPVLREQNRKSGVDCFTCHWSGDGVRAPHAMDLPTPCRAQRDPQIAKESTCTGCHPSTADQWRSFIEYGEFEESEFACQVCHMPKSKDGEEKLVVDTVGQHYPRRDVWNHEMLGGHNLQLVSKAVGKIDPRVVQGQLRVEWKHGQAAHDIPTGIAGKAFMVSVQWLDAGGGELRNDVASDGITRRQKVPEGPDGSQRADSVLKPGGRRSWNFDPVANAESIVLRVYSRLHKKPSDYDAHDGVDFIPQWLKGVIADVEEPAEKAPDYGVKSNGWLLLRHCVWQASSGEETFLCHPKVL